MTPLEKKLDQLATKEDVASLPTKLELFFAFVACVVVILVTIFFLVNHSLS